jgi:hypothetical protein
LTPLTPISWLPAGNHSNCRINMNVAAARRAAPMPICTFRFDHFATTPAPSHAPRIAATIIDTSVRTSTGMTVM